MRQISLVGAVDEEVGDYFPEFLDMLEESPFLKVRNIIYYIIVMKVDCDREQIKFFFPHFFVYC